MADFNSIQQGLHATRAGLLAADKAWLETKEKLKKKQGEIDAFERSMDPKNNAQKAQLAAMQKDRQALETQLQSAAVAREGLRAQDHSWLQELLKNGNPETQINNLDSDTPILLFPLRIETRFKTTGSQKQLWVRVYPDDCQIEAFSELLSQSEHKNAIQFWSAFWSAGQDETGQRAAWRKLVGAHGSGRAGWIVEHFLPLNPAEQPVKVNENDWFLIISANFALTPEEESAALTFWENYWKHEGDTAARQADVDALSLAAGAKAEQIIKSFVPDNFSEELPTGKQKSGMNVKAVILRLPDPATLLTSGQSWTQAPKVRTLPERFVLKGYYNNAVDISVVGNAIPSSLDVGPDPSLSETGQIMLEDGELKLNEELKWLTDFDLALSKGMAFRINLTDTQYNRGFQKLTVMGVRFTNDRAGGKDVVKRLLLNHHNSKNGVSILKQGTPTNNTDDGASGHTWLDDADASYDIVFKGVSAFDENETDPLKKKDGQWLAEWLGIEPAFLKKIPGAGNSDQLESRAMNTALWEGTWGYFMDEMLRGIFTRGGIEKTRVFFNQYVSGRGWIPPIRIGKQPYGILPVTVWGRLPWSFSKIPLEIAIQERDENPQDNTGIESTLYLLINKLETEWDKMAKDVPWVGKVGDVHQILLDIVGLHSGSVEYHQRYAHGLKQVYNQLAMKVGSFGAALFLGAFQEARTELLTGLGIDPAKVEGLPMLDKLFKDDANVLQGPVVDDAELSETDPLSSIPTNDKNYIAWLNTSAMEAIRTQNYGPGRKTPKALLYLMLRHSLMLTWWDGSIQLLANKNIIDRKSWRKEPELYNISVQDPGISRFEPLYMKNSSVTGDANTRVGDFIGRPASLLNLVEAKKLAEVKKALTALEDTPTARLERLFSEHIDLCSYRLDAWKQALVHQHLEKTRYTFNAAGQPGYNSGVYVGSYGWLENVKSENKVLQPVNLAPELSAVFQKIGQPALTTDSNNAGYLHAPSLNQAMTAAVLKNAYIEHAASDNDSLYAINLSSERVRKAQQLLEGIRNGQRLSDMLGFMLERGLHDLAPAIEADKFIWPLRQAFPDSAMLNRIIKVGADPIDDTERVATVINGHALIDHIRQKVNKHYPFGLPIGVKPGELPAATAAEAAAIDHQVDLMMSANDAVADLLLSESVYQAVQGNFERSAASANVLSEGKFPSDMEVVKTPRTGITLTHRIAIHLDTTASKTLSPNTVAMTPRAAAEAPLNLWLSKLLPDPAALVVRAAYKTPGMATETTVDVTIAALGMQPIDLLYAVNFDLEQSMTWLDDRIVNYLRVNHTTHPGASFRIDYTTAVPGSVTLFEAASLLRSLRHCVLQSRPLHAGDPGLPLDKKSLSENWNLADVSTRTVAAILTLQNVEAALLALEADAASDLDAYSASAANLFLQASMYGIHGTGIGFMFEGISSIYSGIQQKLEVVTTRWNKKATDFDAVMAGYPMLAEDADKYELLKKAERLISITYSEPLPDTPDNYKVIVENKKALFDGLRASLNALRTAASPSLTAFLLSAEPLILQIGDYDVVWYDPEREKNDIDPDKDRAASLRTDLTAKVKALREDVSARIAACNLRMADADASSSFPEKRGILEDAYRKVLGDEFRMFPPFTLGSELAAETQNIHDTSATQLMKHLNVTLSRPFAVDEWMYGVARVRERMHHWENLVFLSEAFGGSPAALTPMQFPYKPEDSWLALEYPDTYKIDSDKNLYTAQLPGPLSAAAPLAGFLLDEWTEVLPGSEETTGVAFHYDQPNQEPPQAILLSVSPSHNSRWSWADLEDSIHETFDNARKRAVEPTQVDKTLYGTFLPATMMAVTTYLYTIANNLGLNNDVYKNLSDK